MNITLYGNGSSGNHGCEAIIRGTVALLGAEKNSFRIQSAGPQEDKSYGLGSLAQIFPATCAYKKGFLFLKAYLKLKLTGNYTDMDGLSYLPGIRQASVGTDIALSVGGDNYCYGSAGIYGYLNQAYRKNGIKTALWGCSIEPDVVTQKSVSDDLSRYSLIVARESITYEAVRHVQQNAFLTPDPAFFMAPQICNMDDRFLSRNIIGINISPMIISNETTPGAAYENYKQLIRYVLTETDACAALIPHVVWKSNDDRTVLRQLYHGFNDDPRLILAEDHTAPELKYIISHCSFFVGARTHATIAAYSTCVPTLVVGYSVKARGIARDLFGTEDGYVLPVQELSAPDQLSKSFAVLYGKRDAVHDHLSRTLPDYLARAQAGVDAVKGLSLY